MASDALLAVAVLLGLGYVRYGPVGWNAISALLPQPSLWGLLYVLVWVTVLTLYGLYRPRAHWSIRTEAIQLFRATITMAALTLAFLFLAQAGAVSRPIVLAAFPILGLATLASRIGLRSWFNRMRRQGRNLRWVLVLGTGAQGRDFAAKVEAHRELGLKMVGFLGDPPKAGRLQIDRWRYLGAVDDLPTVLHSRVVDEVAICLPYQQWDAVDAIASLCAHEGKIVRIPVALPSSALHGGIEDLDGTPVLSLVSGPDAVVALAFKRAIDIGLAALGLVLLAPLLLGIATAIVVSDGRPIVFRQERVGLNGRTFRVWKFRTMVRDAEARQDEVAAQNEINGQAFKVTADPRVTPLGRWLRRTSLDELPQLVNVLKGEMSLVGPRPPLPSEVRAYDMWHRRRLSMKPGITGLWQVAGRRDPEFDRWVEKDLEYIDRWSTWLDLQIIIRTIPAMLRSEGR